MVKIDKVYTGGGDTGSTSLGNGDRVTKDSLRIQVCGAIDEVNAAIGVARLYAEGAASVMLERIQNDLFDLGADLCVPEDLKKKDGLRIGKVQVLRLEEEIDNVNALLSPLNSFVLPGGSTAAAFVHLARTITRRAERLVTGLDKLEPISPHSLPYLNRLSDHLFVLARHLNNDGLTDHLWVPGENN